MARAGREPSAQKAPSFELLPDTSEQTELITRLAAVIAAAGYEHFVSTPILLPDSKFFPDRWTADSAGVHRLTKRLLQYAGVGDLGVDMVSYEDEDASSTGHHTGVAGWFAGIVDGRCRFGFDERHVEDDDAIVGVMCHEVAHAFRHHRAITGDDHDREEEDTDVTTVYLGFGVLAANNAYRFRTSGSLQGGFAVTHTSESSIGYLSARSMTFLLAAQVVLRREERAARRAIASALESNQAAFFRAALAALETDDLEAKLGVPPRAQWPSHVALDELKAPIVDDAPPVTRPKKKKTRRRANEGQRVFRVERTRAFFLACVAGCVTAMALAFTKDMTIIAIGGAAAAGVGWALGRRMHIDYCSDPACEADIPLSAKQCPGCAGEIVGTIRHPKERLEALERIEARERRDLQGRYEGKPMRLVVDHYALAVIGALSAEKEDGVVKIVQDVLGGGDDWRATVRKTMGWPANVDEEIRTNWSRFQQMARDQEMPADAVAFAESFGDEFSKY